MPLEKDNAAHRGISNNLDAKYGGGTMYEKLVRPVMHGVYHTARGIGSGNTQEFARAKDQFSKVGTGQQRSDYLKAHQEAATKK